MVGSDSMLMMRAVMIFLQLCLLPHQIFFFSKVLIFFYATCAKSGHYFYFSLSRSLLLTGER